MLTFEEKLEIISSFPELTRKDVSLGRVNFHYEESASDKKNVVYHLHPNGNGFVYAKEVHGLETDSKGLVNIRDFGEKELRNIVQQAIKSLAPVVEEEMVMEEWINEEEQLLVMIQEDDGWNVYAGVELDGAFHTYGEAADYLEQEGFRKE
ncbi:hypothetical protein [Alteribacillus sp. HJP-4]|uniref:hypothetical protein n=1 Tax=Alteribacillus sp. HJP-4 TaxID=2775394 RepID=UPI0035CD16B5